MSVVCLVHVRRSYLDHDELRRGGYCEHKSVKNGRHLMQYLYWRSEDKGELAKEGGRLGQVTESDMGQGSEGRHRFRLLERVSLRVEELLRHSPRYPMRYVSNPSFAKLSAWYIIRGLRPTSPRTMMATERSFGGRLTYWNVRTVKRTSRSDTKTATTLSASVIA